MGEKTGRKIRRLELADYLVQLSEQLRAGALQIEGRTLPVPEEVSLDIHLKEKHGHTIAKLSWEWPAAPSGGPGPASGPARQAPSLGNLKKRLGALFGQLRKVVARGQFPDRQTLADFVADSQAFGELARPEWREQMAAYLDLLGDFKLAAETGSPEALARELQRLHEAMTTCHRDFK